MSEPGKTLTIVWLFLAACLAGGCGLEHTPHRPNANSPLNVRMVIDDDSLATRDTLLRVRVGGENIDYMSISSDSAALDTGWQIQNAIKLLSAPRLEGMFRVFGQFATSGGGTTGVYHDDIRLDFTALINDFQVQASDTLYPDDPVNFSIEAGEIGKAGVSFSSFLAEYQLDSIAPGSFFGSTRIAMGVLDTAAFATAHFTDYAGNDAAPLILERHFIILGEEVNPQLVSRLDLGEAQCSAVWWHLGYCYVSDWQGALHVIDVTNSTIPFLDNSLNMGGATYGSSASEDYLYVADGDAGMAVVSIIPAGSPSLAARVPVAGQPRDVAVDGPYAYVACLFSGLRIYDLASRESPSQCASVPLEGYGESVTYTTRKVYVSGQSGGAIIDAADPQVPRLIAEFMVDGIPRASAYFGGYFYFATEQEGLVVYDVREPTNPLLAAEYPEYTHPFAIAVAAPYLLVGGEGTLWVLNLANPRALREVGRVEELNEIRGIFHNEGIIYLAEEGAFSIVSISGR